MSKSAILLNQREPGRMKRLDTPSISAATGVPLRLTVRTKELQHLRPIIEAIAFCVVENQTKWLAEPRWPAPVKLALCVVATNRDSVLLSPPFVMSTDCSPRNLHQPVSQNIAPSGLHSCSRDAERQNPASALALQSGGKDVGWSALLGARLLEPLAISVMRWRKTLSKLEGFTIRRNLPEPCLLNLVSVVVQNPD